MTKNDFKEQCLSILNTYSMSQRNEPSSFRDEISRLDARKNDDDNTIARLQDLLISDDIDGAADLIKHFLSDVRKRTQQTGLSIFQSPNTDENKMRIGLGQALAQFSQKQAISILCPGLYCESMDEEKLPNVEDLPLEQLLTQFIDSEHQGYLVPVKLIALEDNIIAPQSGLIMPQQALPYNYYYDFLSGNENAVYITQKDLKRLFEHSPQTIKIAQLQKEYHLLQQEDPSLYTQLTLFIARLKMGSVGEQGSEFDTAEKAYTAIIDFYDYYRLLPEDERSKIPAAVDEELKLILGYASDPSKNTDGHGHQEVQTCTATRKKKLLEAVEDPENKAILRTIGTDNATIAAQMIDIENQIKSLKKEIATDTYQGAPELNRVAPLVLNQKWTFEELFEGDSIIQKMQYLSADDITALFNPESGVFYNSFLDTLGFKTNPGEAFEGMLDLVLGMSNDQKIAVATNLMFPILKMPRIMTEYYRHLFGKENFEQAFINYATPDMTKLKADILDMTQTAEQREQHFVNYRVFMEDARRNKLAVGDLLNLSPKQVSDFYQANPDDMGALLVIAVELPFPSQTIAAVLQLMSDTTYYHSELGNIDTLLDILDKAKGDLTETDYQMLIVKYAKQSEQAQELQRIKSMKLIPDTIVQERFIQLSSQKDFINKISSFGEIISWMENFDLTLEQKKKLLSEVVAEHRDRSFYAGLSLRSCEFLINEPELLQIAPNQIMAALLQQTKNNMRQILEQDRDNHFISRYLVTDFAAAASIFQTFDSKVLQSCLQQDSSLSWPKINTFKGTPIESLQLYECCDLLKNREIATYIISCPDAPVLLQELIEREKNAPKKYVSQFFQTKKGADFFDSCSSFDTLYDCLGSLGTKTQASLLEILATKKIALLTELATTKEQQNIILKDLQKNSFLYRYRLSFLEPLVIFFTGPTAVSRWKQHMVRSASLPLNPIETEKKSDSRPSESTDSEITMESSKQLVFSQTKSNDDIQQRPRV